MVLSLLLPVVLLSSGLAAGVLVGTQLGGFPLLAALPADRYVHAHAFFATRYDPFMPGCFVTTAFVDLLLVFLAPEPAAAVLFLLGTLLTLFTMAISVTKNVPTNRWVQTLDPDALPADFDYVERRAGWGRWNRTRSYLAVAAFLVNCIALGVLI